LYSGYRSATHAERTEQQIADLSRSVQQHRRDIDLGHVDETMSGIGKHIQMLSKGLFAGYPLTKSYFFAAESAKKLGPWRGNKRMGWTEDGN
jgi:hypothetical protein